jgi:hypothetical protein
LRFTGLLELLGTAAILAAIVAIRTFLNFSLEVEITGRWPGKQGFSTGATDNARDENFDVNSSNNF